MVTNSDASLFKLLISPSFFSSVVVIFLTSFLVLSAVVPKFYGGTDLQIYSDLAKEQEFGIYSNLAVASDAVNKNEYVANASIFMFWGVVGLTVYYFILALGKVLLNTLKFYELMGFTKGQNRKRLEIEAMAHFALRLAALLVIYGAYKLLMSYIIPYGFVNTQQSLNTSWVQGLLQVCITASLYLVIFHVITIALRLVRLRPRFFGSAQ